MRAPQARRGRGPGAPAGIAATTASGSGRGPAPAPETPPLGVLANRRFLSLWLAQAATQVGGNMVLYGLTILVYGVTRSNSAVSLLILTFLVPAVVFSAVAGVFVDRLDRRLILISTNLLRGAAFLLMVVVSDQLALVYLLNIVVSTLTTFFAPAEAAMIPFLVERERLLQANGLFTFTLNASFAMGFALLGPLVVNLAGADALLLLVAALYFAAAALCATLPPSRPEEAPQVEGALGGAERAVVSLFGQLREGLVYIRSDPRIFWSLAYLAITASLIGVLGVLGPGFATKGLGLREQDFVLVILPLGAGIVMGILILNAYGRYLPRRRVIEGGLLGLALTLFVLSIVGPLTRFLQARAAEQSIVNLGGILSLLSVVVVLALLAGAAYAFVAIPAQTQLQEQLPEEVRGRVFGVLNMLVSISSFLPIVVVGPVADLIGTPTVLVIAALVVAGAGLGSILVVQQERPVAATPAHLEAVDPVTVATGVREHQGPAGAGGMVDGPEGSEAVPGTARGRTTGAAAAGPRAGSGVPASWRIVSAAAYLAAIAVGALVVLFLPWPVVAGLCLAFAAVTLGMAPASRRPPLGALDDAGIAGLTLPVMTVLVAGRDEASVLPNLIADLGAQDHREATGRPAFELIVIDDRSVDGTGEIAMEAARRAGLGDVTRVVRRGPPPGAQPDPDEPQLPDGKGAALSATAPADYNGEAVVVLDADARLGPAFLRRAASYFGRGAGAMTAHRRILAHPQRTWLADQLQGAQADEESVDGEINCGRWAAGGCSEFRGNGIMVRRDLLEAVGGWHAHALCEDLDLSSRLAAHGVRVGWAADAVAWEEPVTNLTALRRQRLRWGEGIIRRELELSLPLLRSARLPALAKLDYLAYSAQTLLPVVLLAALVVGVVVGSWPVIAMLFATYLVPGGVLAADSIHRDGVTGVGRIPERLGRAGRVLVFSGLWLPVFALCWPRVVFGAGRVRYAKTDHVGAPEGFRPGDATPSGDGS